MRSIILFILVIFSSLAYSQVTLKLTALPAKYTPTLDSLFVAGNFNNWNPRDTSLRFRKNGQGQWQVTINTASNPLLFKITRGNWATVEVAANGQDIPNRSANNVANSQLDIPVADWADTRGNHTSTDQVSILTSQLWLKALGRYRRIWVCVPPDYQTNINKRYPVIYLHDGQNVFDAATSFAGEWRVDEALQTLSLQAGWEPVIAVGIDNGGGERINELTPFRNATYGGGQGEKYGQALVEDVKPMIDSLFRTKKERIHTAVGGSSLGGIQTLFMGYAWPQVYSKLLVFSPSLWFSDSLQNYIYAQPQPQDLRIHLLAGTNESASMTAETNAFYNGLLAAGFPASNISKNIIAGGTHSEGFWSQHVKSGLEFLFATTTSVKKNDQLSEEKDLFRQLGEKLVRKSEDGQSVTQLFLLDIQGKIIPLEMQDQNQWKIPQIPAGIYFIRYQIMGHEYFQKIGLNRDF